MIKTMLILLLIHYIGLYLFNYKHDTLNCGIFGWAGKDVKKFNKDKFDKLGILNVERGKSSCGVSFDGDIQIGIDSNKFYYDFIIDRDINPKRFPTVIGHTRQASNGTVNVYNAHPFGFGDNNNDFVFIGAHNGTLKNHKELAKKYEIEESVENSYTDKFDKEINVKRDKIDSELLLEIIYKHKNFKVLSEYIGGAALVFTDTTSPNILYLFKGKSKDWASSSHESTERPMYVYVENKNSMYYSSLEDTLRTIGGRDNNIIDIEPNVVYKITDGDFKGAEKIIITRINATQNPSYVNTKHYGRGYGAFDEMDGWNDNIYGTAMSPAKKEDTEEKSRSIITLPAAKNVIEETKKDNPVNIYNETLLKPKNDYYGVPYFNKLRWYRNGQLITGIYVWINEYGYYPVGSSSEFATKKFYYILDRVFDGKTFLEDYDAVGKKPFNSANNINPTFFYFVQGVQIRTVFDYNHFYRLFSNLAPSNHLDYIQLSQVSTHPIINLNFSERGNDYQNILKNGNLYDGTITPLGSEKNYTIEKGNLVSTKVNSYFSNINKDYYKIKSEIAIPLSSETIVSERDVILEDYEDSLSEQNDDLLIDSMIEKEEEENQIIKDLCEEDFTEPIKDFQQIRTKLFNNFSDNITAIKVIHFVDNALKDMKEFIN